MFLLYIFSFIFLLVSSIIMLFSSLLSKKSILTREKIPPFECGFDPKSSARLPFSLQFFLIAVIFLIFDIEIAILLPIFIIFKCSLPFIWLISSTFFLIVLILGLYHEWHQGALNWAT